MKKVFTLLLVAVVAVAARATDYNVPITVNVNGVTSEQRAVLTVNENGGLYDISLKNFVLQSEDGPMGVGNVELKGIKPYQDGSTTLLLTNDKVTITPGDDPNVSFWMANMLPPVNVELRGKIDAEHLRCYIDIDLMESLQQVIQVAIGEGYQIANQGFENWHTSTGTYQEPNAWHSFESATGMLAEAAGHHIEKSNDAHSGETSARIFATSIFGIVANGTMTTGRMNAASMSADDASGNYAYLDMSQSELDGNGDPYYTPLYSVPDEVAVWVKFKQATPNAAHPYATLSAVVTDGTRYQEPENQTYTNVVAKANNSQIATTGGQWVRVTAPFTYTANSAEPKAVLVTLSTNADPGQGSKNDEMLVDDIQFIYHANVTGLKVKGQSVPGFSADKTNYEMELNETITADDIEVAVDGRTAHVIKEVVVEGDHYLLTVRAISADMANMTTYVVTVKSSATAITQPSTANAQHPTANTYYTLDGRRVETLIPGQVYISRQADGTTLKVRR